MANPFRLSTFLSGIKDQCLRDIHESNSKALSEWTVVMGNEAGGAWRFVRPPRSISNENKPPRVADLDSIASSIAYSWLETEVHKRKSIPLIRLNYADLVLRKENIHALTLSGLKTGARELLYMNDLPGTKPFPFNKFALVDHNLVGSSFLADSPTARVVAVVDHHDDEGLYKDTANPRIILPSRSCSSIIARLCPPEIPKELATLLLCAILIDTGGGLVKKRGVPDIDYDAITFLAPLSAIGSSLALHISGSDSIHDSPAIERLAAELHTMKGDVSHLSPWDLLRRDYKEYTHPLPWADPGISIKAGLSTVPLSLGYLLTEGKLGNQVQPWMTSRTLAVHGILTSYWDTSKSGKRKHRREQLWIVRGGTERVEASTGDESDRLKALVNLDTLAERLFTGLEASKELDLKRKQVFDVDKEGGLPSGMRARVYDQKNAGASRKVIAPTIKKILESDGPVPPIITLDET
jgi:exopolyphosphatase